MLTKRTVYGVLLTEALAVALPATGTRIRPLCQTDP